MKNFVIYADRQVALLMDTGIQEAAMKLLLS
jgi:hypothetical protein